MHTTYKRVKHTKTMLKPPVQRQNHCNINYLIVKPW